MALKSKLPVRSIDGFFFFFYWCVWKWWVYFYFIFLFALAYSLTEILFSSVLALCAMDLVILQAIHFPILALESELTLDLLLSFWFILTRLRLQVKKNQLNTLKFSPLFSNTNFIKRRLFFNTNNQNENSSHSWQTIL